ncbi:MAG: hypothetical protein Q9209_005888 [Squamulea sp. 1 TL-2023]
MSPVAIDANTRSVTPSLPGNVKLSDVTVAFRVSTSRAIGLNLEFIMSAYDNHSPSPITPNAKSQKRLVKEAAEREELLRQEAILNGGRTVGVAANPHYGAKRSPAKGKAVAMKRTQREAGELYIGRREEGQTEREGNLDNERSKEINKVRVV